MFYFKLNRAFIQDNGSGRPLLGLFGHDFSNVKFLSFVTADNDDLPSLDAFAQETDPARRAAILRPFVEHVLASRELTEIGRVTDNAALTFGDTGFVLYEAKAIPESFNWTFLAIKSNRATRLAGQATDEVLGDSDFGAFADNLTTLIAAGAGAVNPAYAAAMAVAKFVTHVIAKNMEHAGDQQLGLVYASFNRAEHYPHGERKADGVPDLTRNMAYDYSMFGFERATAANPPTA
jgi:hypothetical protein